MTAEELAEAKKTKKSFTIKIEVSNEAFQEDFNGEVDAVLQQAARFIKHCIHQVENNLLSTPSVKWYFDRCQLLKKYFNQFNESDLKKRQYRYKEYNVPYTTLIKNLNEQVRYDFYKHFNEELL